MFDGEDIVLCIYGIDRVGTETALPEKWELKELQEKEESPYPSLLQLQPNPIQCNAMQYYVKR